LDGYGAAVLDSGICKANGVLTGTSFVTGPPRIQSDAPFVRPLPDPSWIMQAISTPIAIPYILMPQIVT
jgi:hypothetical protein